MEREEKENNGAVSGKKEVRLQGKFSLQNPVKTPIFARRKHIFIKIKYF